MVKKQETEKREYLVYFTIMPNNFKGNAEISTDEKLTFETIHNIKEQIAKQLGVDFSSTVIQNIMELK